jgi:hypothetical protein
MTQLLIRLERGPDGQPAGELTTEAGHTVSFAGWLHLIRILEDQLSQARRGSAGTPPRNDQG